MTPALDGDLDSASAPPAFDPTDLTSVARAAWGDLLEFATPQTQPDGFTGTGLTTDGLNPTLGADYAINGYTPGGAGRFLSTDDQGPNVSNGSDATEDLIDQSALPTSAEDIANAGETGVDPQLANAPAQGRTFEGSGPPARTPDSGSITYPDKHSLAWTVNGVPIEYGSGYGGDYALEPDPSGGGFWEYDTRNGAGATVSRTFMSWDDAYNNYVALNPQVLDGAESQPSPAADDSDSSVGSDVAPGPANSAPADASTFNDWVDSKIRPGGFGPTIASADPATPGWQQYVGSILSGGLSGFNRGLDQLRRDFFPQTPTEQLNASIEAASPLGPAGGLLGVLGDTAVGATSNAVRPLFGPEDAYSSYIADQTDAAHPFFLDPRHVETPSSQASLAGNIIVGLAGAGPIGGVLKGAGGMQPPGIIYTRIDLNGDISPYVGQSQSEERFLQRQAEHARNFRNADFWFRIVDRANPGVDLDVVEHRYIQQLTGGQRASASPRVSNLRDPVGPARRSTLGLPEPTR